MTRNYTIKEMKTKKDHISVRKMMIIKMKMQKCKIIINSNKNKNNNNNRMKNLKKRKINEIIISYLSSFIKMYYLCIKYLNKMKNLFININIIHIYFSFF